MASLREFLEVLADAYPDERVRGKEFEPFLRDALVASPSHQFAEVWLWDDWPGCDGPDRGFRPRPPGPAISGNIRDRWSPIKIRPEVTMLR